MGPLKSVGKEALGGLSCASTFAYYRERSRAHFVRAKVCVHAYPDSRLAIFHGPRCLMAFDPGEETVETFDAAA